MAYSRLFRFVFDKRLRLQGLLLLLGCAASGCGNGGPDDLPDLAAVTGFITLDGQPLANARVVFLPEKSGGASGAITAEDGSYELKYRSGEPGAALGKHAVQISTDVDGAMTPEAERVPAQFNRETTLSAEVTEGPNEHDFDLKSL
jgi:hypothetical protein